MEQRNPWKSTIDDVIAGFPYIPSPLREFDGDEIPCQHEIFSQQLLNSGHCKTIEEARRTPRMLYFSCPKCKTTYL